MLWNVHRDFSVGLVNYFINKTSVRYVFIIKTFFESNPVGIRRFLFGPTYSAVRVVYAFIIQSGLNISNSNRKTVTCTGRHLLLLIRYSVKPSRVYVWIRVGCYFYHVKLRASGTLRIAKRIFRTPIKFLYYKHVSHPVCVYNTGFTHWSQNRNYTIRGATNSEIN